MSDLARTIYQSNLDQVSAALMAGDLAEMLRVIAIPSMMSTRDCEIVMSSPEVLDMVMHDFRNQLLAKGVRDYRRICTEARFVAGMTDMIAGLHRTEARAAGDCVVPPYLNHMVLMRIGGQWQGIWLQSVMDNTELEILSPYIAAAQAQAHRIKEHSGR